MNIAERLKQDSFQQCIHVGMEKGEQKKATIIAKNFLSEGIKVKNATGLPDEIILKSI